MNDLIMNGALGSPMFTFLVGTYKREMQVHSAIVSSASPVLNNLVHGGMRESRDKLVDWSHVDEATFNRFCEFLYTGDYTVPSPLLDFALATEQNETFQFSNHTAGFDTTEQAATEQPIDHGLAIDHGPEDLSIRPILTYEQWRPELLQRYLPEFGGLEVPSLEELAWSYNFNDRWMPQGDSRVQDWTAFFCRASATLCSCRHVRGDSTLPIFSC
ncbi:unnamed protein product [Penicillium salamii]|uniref:BTB domain-containing protein n=1 Tax=Penicillium salamii TaxID=1612424 RepID=A0A9W4JIX3_9EURO|nr:unnamed protein product [Penicillium salamii]CAG7941600.1 unnamed protein product [Penicillium salamii]CAG8120664.1 unnamed protein product [Penicillium salamii]CAG8155620.1 unnamed protein product [Penicillium salamii]CAG8232252.1 unnamed protein product [Penicillium salamii]